MFGLSSRTLVALTIITPVISACAGVASPTAVPIKPSQFDLITTRDLCLAYVNPSHPSHLKQDLKAELVRRGAGICTDPGYLKDQWR